MTQVPVESPFWHPPEPKLTGSGPTKFMIQRLRPDQQHYCWFRVQHVAYTSWGSHQAPPPRCNIILCLCVAHDHSSFKWTPVFRYTVAQGWCCFVGAEGRILYVPLNAIKRYDEREVEYYLRRINRSWDQPVRGINTSPAFCHPEPHSPEIA